MVIRSSPILPVALTEVGNEPGDELVHQIAVNVAAPGSLLGVGTADSKIVLATPFGPQVIDASGTVLTNELIQRPTAISSLTGLARIGDNFYGVGGNVSIFRFDLKSDSGDVVADLNLGGSTYAIAATPDGNLILSAPCLHGAEIPHQAIALVALG
jgi:hypothetical protein